jgi:hypothetical protein
MATSQTATLTRRSIARRYVPPQHGAWAMLLLPWLAGVLVAGFHWLQVPLLLAWLSGYLASYFALLAVKTRRLARYRTQLCVYGTPTVVLGAVVLAARPQLLLYAPAYALLLAVNAAYAAARNERAVLNDLASVALSCLMVFVCATVAGTPPSRVAVAFTVVTAYFVGTVLHVKALIRERRDARYRRASIGYHILALAGALWLGTAIAVAFALLAARAAVLPRWRLSPARIGIVEIVASLVVLIAVVVSPQ